MVFSGILFLFRFLPIFFICYFMVPKRMRNFVLFFGSLVFYAWGEPVYILLMLFSTISDYIHGLYIEKFRGKMGAKVLLCSSVAINLGLLGFFKYSGLGLPLPIGISFYTFQTMSYTIDVYRGETPAQHNLLDFGTFVAMFPQLIAGPIVKYKTVAGELKERSASLSEQAKGAQRFVIGLGKKVLLANNIGRLFTEISGYEAGNLTGLLAWMGILAYAFQIYFDFSGYSDMAIGLGQILGFHFPENFNYPYIATSITDFWRRWHMSLGSWFREYVYIPLGGNRKGLPRQLINIMIVWALTGIWHGAGFNFLLWGIWFAVFLALEKVFLGRLLARIPNFFGWCYSMAVVLLGWCFFSLEETDGILRFLKAMFGLGSAGFADNRSLYLLQNYGILFLMLAAGSTPLVKAAVKRWEENVVLKNLFLAVILLLSIAGIVDASYNPFLYFRF